MTAHLTRRDFVEATAVAAAMPLLTRFPFPEALQASMDADLKEVTIPQLHAMYAAKKYTVTQVTHWYLDHITRHNPVYRAILHVDARGALATAAAQDAAAARGGAGFKRGALWGVPMVIKANTSVKGLITSAGWTGFMIPGFELVAPADATVVTKLKAAGVVIVGQTNMPDFAASDGNISSVYGRTGNAYNWRFATGGSSGGTVTSVSANMAVLGTGTDTGNSIRMPSATSCVVGVLPTRGLTSISGIVPLDWLRDNTGPIARTVTDAAIALGVMAGEDAKDFRTLGSAKLAQPGPYTQYLKAEALKGKRFGVPAFIVATPAGNNVGGSLLQPETRAVFMNAIEEMRAAGATVVFDDTLMPASFLSLTGAINTGLWIAEGTDAFLRDYGPAAYHSPAEYATGVGAPLPGTIHPIPRPPAAGAPMPPPRPLLVNDPEAEARLWEPQRKALAAYHDVFDRFKLDGLVYPAIQMPPFDEVAVALKGGRSAGPHSNTDWVNPIGTPAISVPAGFYENGLPFNIELAARQWRDGDLLGFAYAFEQATHHRKAPVLVEKR